MIQEIDENKHTSIPAPSNPVPTDSVPSNPVKTSWKSQELRDLESQMQKIWKDTDTHKTDTNFDNPKTFFATFPYPYMNGYLHLGHGFTLSKYDFACRFYRKLNYDVLEPFSFHVTGMPIVAAADKLKQDIKDIENGIVTTNTLTDKSQYKIMQKMDISADEMIKFTIPEFWGEYFSNAAKLTLNRFGIAYDDSRSFITTDANPYYDRFIKWQFAKLHKKNVLRFGTRCDLFSLKENQPCLGHERSDGEDAKPIKLSLIAFKISNNEQFIKSMGLNDGNQLINTMIPILIMASTTKPETICDAVNLSINGNGTFDIFLVDTQNVSTYWICQEYTITSLQKQLRPDDKHYIQSAEKISSVNGKSVIMSGVNVLNEFNDQYIPLCNLNKNKNNYISYDNVTKGIVNNISIMIRQDNDKDNDKDKDNDNELNQGFDPVTKSLLEHMIDYYEPDQLAISRSGERLIVAKMDQWFIDYGDLKWKQDTCAHIETMIFTDPSVKNALSAAVTWLEQWPCSRIYGLGSRFPEGMTDKEHMIDSLSDSTIYMALYTIYHLFKELNISPQEMTDDVFDNIFLLKDYDLPKYNKYKLMQKTFMHYYPVNLRVSAKDLINNHLAMCIFNHVAIWDQEFKHRHAQYYPDKTHNFGPQMYQINGYIAVEKLNKKNTSDKNTENTNNQSTNDKSTEVEKMSKSKGNFKTLDQAINLYTSDAIRFTFASANDGVDDAYFDQDLCTKIIEKLYKEKEWIEETLTLIDSGIYSKSIIEYPEEIFINEMNHAIQETIKNYHKFNYREVVKLGFHTMQGLRDNYVFTTSTHKINMNPSVLILFIKMHLGLMDPIIPHFCGYFSTLELYQKHIHKQKHSHNQSKIIFDPEDIKRPIDISLCWQNKYLDEIGSEISKKISQYVTKKKTIKKITIIVAENIRDPIESISIKIMEQTINNMFLESAMIIESATHIDPEIVKNNKNLGEIIKCYKQLESIIGLYGREWYDVMITGKIEEYNAIDLYLKYHLKQNTLNKYEIEVYRYDEEYINKNGAMVNVRMNNPVIIYE